MRRHYNGNMYEFNEAFFDFLREWKGYLIVFGGPSGVGKTTLSEKMPFPSIRSITTRNKRKNYETYDFVCQKEFNHLYENNQFASVVKFKNDSYGFTLEHFKEVAANNSVIVLTLSPLGYRLLKQRYARCIGVFVYADKETVLKRLKNRDGHIDEIRERSFDNNMRSYDFYHLKVKNNHPFYSMHISKIFISLKLIQLLDKNRKMHKIRKKIFKTKTHRTRAQKKNHVTNQG